MKTIYRDGFWSIEWLPLVAEASPRLVVRYMKRCGQFVDLHGFAGSVLYNQAQATFKAKVDEVLRDEAFWVQWCKEE